MNLLFSIMFIIFGIVAIFKAESIYTVAALFGVAAIFNIAFELEVRRKFKK